MALVRVDVEIVIIRRLGNLMAVAGMDVAPTGNDDLNDPLAWAVRMVGGTTASYSTTTSAEIAAVGEALYDDLFDLAEYRTLLSIQGNLAAKNISNEVVEIRLAEMRRALASYLSPMKSGYLRYDFAEHGETQ